MSGEEVIKYDVESSLSFVTSLQTIFGIMAGFVFTGTTVVLSTLGEPVTFLSQLVLFVLFCAMVMFTTAMYELHLVSNLVSWQSPKQIVPLYPARLRIINTLGIPRLLSRANVPSLNVFAQEFDTTVHTVDMHHCIELHFAGAPLQICWRGDSQNF